MRVFNLLEERSLNDYIITQIKPSSIRRIENTEFACSNIDEIANNMVYQYIKKRIREYYQQLLRHVIQTSYSTHVLFRHPMICARLWVNCYRVENP